MEFIITAEKRAAIIQVLGAIPANQSYDAITALLTLPAAKPAEEKPAE